MTSIQRTPFQAQLQTVLDDGKITEAEVSDLRSAATQTLDGADNKATAAADMRGTMAGLNAQILQTEMYGMGSRSEILDAAADAAFGHLDFSLAKTMAKNADSGFGDLSQIDPAGGFAKGVYMILESLSARFMGSASLGDTPTLVDQELGQFNSVGLTGPAKLALDKAGDERGAALLAFVGGLKENPEVPRSLHPAIDEMYRAVFQATTGGFAPPEQLGGILEEISAIPTPELAAEIEGFRDQVETFEVGGSYAKSRQQQALFEGLGMMEDILAAKLETAE